SEERRVGKECKTEWWAKQQKKNLEQQQRQRQAQQTGNDVADPQRAAEHRVAPPQPGHARHVRSGAWLDFPDRRKLCIQKRADPLSLRRPFFFQAEDGIRDYKVTGVQTCALPICHFLKLLQRANLLAELLAVANDRLRGQLRVDRLLLLFLALDEARDAVERHATVIAD